MAPEKTDPDESVVSEEGGGSSSVGGGEGGEHDPYFEPVVPLPEVVIIVGDDDDDEEEMIRLRCKLFRYNTAESPPEWKERGTGDIKILRNKHHQAQVRILMRQDKTLKIRANHYITPYMQLKPNCSSDRAFVWSVVADFADEEPKQELFAARFANADNARLFCETFDKARGIATVAIVRAQEEEEEEEQQQEEEEEKRAREEKEEEEHKETEEEEEEEDSTTCTTATTTTTAATTTATTTAEGSDSVVESLKAMTVKE